MITLKDFFEATGYRITEGSEWNDAAYGPYAYSLESWNGKHDDGGRSALVVFDTRTQVVYEVSVCDFSTSKAYKFVNPEFDTEDEAIDDMAWDGVMYSRTYDGEDLLVKMEAIMSGEEYDGRVVIMLEFPKEELLALSLDAHKLDITLNEYFTVLLKRTIDIALDSKA